MKSLIVFLISCAPLFLWGQGNIVMTGLNQTVNNQYVECYTGNFFATCSNEDGCDVYINANVVYTIAQNRSKFFSRNFCFPRMTYTTTGIVGCNVCLAGSQQRPENCEFDGCTVTIEGRSSTFP